MKAKCIYKFLNELAPIELKMDFDNVGLLVGDPNAEVKSCLVALDITDAVIDEAAHKGAQLIVSHHPVIFEAMKSVLPDDEQGRKLIKLIKNDIAAVCMHTNLDIAEGGVNDALMAALGCPVSAALDPDGCGRVGEYPQQIEMNDFLELCKTALNANGLRYHDAGRSVKRIAVMGGSGGGSLHCAFELGCDTYVTADVKYNHFLSAAELGINLIDADHFCTENVVVPVLADKLKAKFPELNVMISERHCQTAKFFV